MAYKYATPYEWLTEVAKDWNATRLYQEVCNLARLLDNDTLQDEYQAEMEQDRYFDEID